MDRCSCAAVSRSAPGFALDTGEELHLAGLGFKPAGVFPFLGPPAGELQACTPLDALWGAAAAKPRGRLPAASTVEQRFRVMEESLLARLQRPLERHAAVRFALGQSNGGPRTKSIGGITERTGLSSRRFIELFRREVGLTPKLYRRVRRFQQALRLIAPAARWIGPRRRPMPDTTTSPILFAISGPFRASIRALMRNLARRTSIACRSARWRGPS